MDSSTDSDAESDLNCSMMDSSTDSDAESGLKVDLEILSIQFLDKTKVRNYVFRNQSILKDEGTNFKMIDYYDNLSLNKLVDEYIKIYNELHRKPKGKSKVATDFILLPKKRDKVDYLQVTYNRVQVWTNRKLEKEKPDPTDGNNSTFILFFFLKDENGRLKNIVAATSGTAWEAVRACCDTTYPIKILEQIGSTDKNIVSIKKRALFGNSTTEIFTNVHLNELYNTSSLYYLVENITCEIDEERASTLLNIIAEHSTSSDLADEEQTTNLSDIITNTLIPSTSNIHILTNDTNNGFNDDSDASIILDKPQKKRKRSNRKVIKKPLILKEENKKKETKRVLVKITTGGIVRIEKKVRSIKSYGQIIICLNQLALEEQQDKRFNLLYFTEVAKESKSELDDTLIESIFDRFHKKQNQIVNLRHAHYEEFLLSDAFEIKIKKKSVCEYFGSEVPDMEKILAWIEMKQETVETSCENKVSTSVEEKKLQFKEIMKEGMLLSSKQSSNKKLVAKLIDYVEGEIVHKGVNYFKIRMKWYRIDVDFLCLMQQDFEGVMKTALIGRNDEGNLPIAWKKKTSLSLIELKKILNTTDKEKMTEFGKKLKAARVSYILENNNNEYSVVQEQLVGEIVKKKEIRDFRNSIELTLQKLSNSSVYFSEKKWNALLLQKEQENEDSPLQKQNSLRENLKIIWQELTRSRKIVATNKVINPIFYGFKDDLKELTLKDCEYNGLIHYLEFCAREQDEGQYNLCYLNEDFIGKFDDHNYLVFDKICPDGIEPCDIFDYTEDTIYIYHVKADFGPPTRDVCSQIINSAVLIQAALKTNQENNFLKKLWNEANKDLLDEEGQNWRLKLHEKLRSLGEENFMNLFYTKDIVFVYAYLASGADKTTVDMNTISDDINDLCRNLGYLNNSGNLTKKFSITTKKKFTDELKNNSIGKDESNKAYKIMSDRQKILDIVNNSCKELGFTNKCGSLTTKFFNTTKEKFVKKIREKNAKHPVRHCEAAYDKLKDRKFSDSCLAKMEVIRLADKLSTFTKQFQFKMCEISREKYNHLTQSSS